MCSPQIQHVAQSTHAHRTRPFLVPERIEETNQIIATSRICRGIAWRPTVESGD